MPTSDGPHWLRLGAVTALLAVTTVASAQQQAPAPPPDSSVLEVDDNGDVSDQDRGGERSLGEADSFTYVLNYQGGVSADTLLLALESAADAGMPLALWQLGLMYESGRGVEPDSAKALNYFRLITDRFEYAPPHSVDADIVASSFIKVAHYYAVGMPDAGIEVDKRLAQDKLLHAATHFRNAEAQYQLALLYLEGGTNYGTIQAIRWFRLAAQKDHHGAQARLGDLLFHGVGIEPAPIEGLMWLTLARRGAIGTSDEGWITELSDSALSSASQDIVERASQHADMLAPQLGG
jgi:TPR repeat protein